MPLRLLGHIAFEGPVQFQGPCRAAAGIGAVAPGCYMVENSCSAAVWGDPWPPTGCSSHRGPLRPAGLCLIPGHSRVCACFLSYGSSCGKVGVPQSDCEAGG